jgi:hypothetical protein
MIKLVDFGKKLLANVEVLDRELIKKQFEEFFKVNSESEYFILLSKEIGYYTVFRKVLANPTQNFIDYLDDSFYTIPEKNQQVAMNSILNLELRDDNSLEIWIGTVYFHLTAFDWGVETI